MYHTCMIHERPQNLHLLLPKEDLKILKRYAQLEKKSVGELIRRAVRQVYGRTEPVKKREVFRRLAGRSELVMENWDKVKKDLLRRYE